MKATLESRTERVEVAFEAMNKSRLVHKQQTLENAKNDGLIFSKAQTKAQIEKCLSKVGINVNYSDMSSFGNGILVTIR